VSVPAIVTDALIRDFVPRRALFGRTRQQPVRALNGVSLRIETGECVALVGPNGAGKTTVLRILATALLPTSGRAEVRGFDVERHAQDVRRRIGVMNGDDRSFFWRLSGRENLTFFGELQGLTTTEARRKGDELIERVGLASAAHQRFNGYSTGMRQRLGIARALLHAPEVLLLDEPTANLDIEHRAQVADLLRERLGSGHVSALIASHDAGLAVSLADRVIRLDQGRVVEASRARERTRYLVRVRGLTDERATALGVTGDEAVIDDLGDGHALAAAIATIVSGGGEVLGVETLPVDLPMSLRSQR
jgi:ABC-2 type transport system ATP-binding protein